MLTNHRHAFLLRVSILCLLFAGVFAGSAAAQAMLIQDFESASLGQTFPTMGQGVAEAVVVADPLNASNKVLRHRPGNSYSQSAFVLTFTLEQGKNLSNYTSIRVRARMNDGDVGNKNLVAGAFQNAPTGNFMSGDTFTAQSYYLGHVATGAASGAWRDFVIPITNTRTFTGTIHIAFGMHTANNAIWFVDNVELVAGTTTGGGGGGVGSTTCTVACPNIVNNFESLAIGTTLGTMGWGNATAASRRSEIVADPVNASNKVLQFTPADFNALPFLSFALPTGTTLSNYRTFTFRGRFSAGDVGHKTIFVAAYGSSPTGAFDPATAPVIGSVVRNAGASTAWETITVNIPNTSTLSGTVFIAFGMSTAAATGGVTTVWFADDVTLVGDGTTGGGGGGGGSTNALLQDYESFTIGHQLLTMGWGTSAANRRAEVVADPVNASNKVMRFTPADFNALPVVQFTLPTGNTLANYTSFTFRGRFSAGDVGFKTIYVAAYGSSPSGAFDPATAPVLGTFARNAAASNAWETITVTIPNTSALSGTVFFAFGMSTAAAEGGTTTAWFVDDVQLVGGTTGGGGGGTTTCTVACPSIVKNFEANTIGQTLGTLGWANATAVNRRAEVVADPLNASNKVLSFTPADYNALPFLDFALPTGTTLANYRSFSFRGRFSAGDVGFKTIYVAAYGASPSGGFDPTTAPILGSFVRNAAASTAWETITVDITNTSTLTGTVFIAFGMSTAAADGGVTTVWFADDVTLVGSTTGGGGSGGGGTPCTTNCVVNVNGGFENTNTGVVTNLQTGIDGWVLEANNGAAATFEVVNSPVFEGNRALRVLVTNIGTPVQAWNIQAVNVGIPAVAGNTYRFSARARAASGNASAAFTVGNAAFQEYGAMRDDVVLPTTEWWNFTFTFTITDGQTVMRAPIHFGFAANLNVPIFIDAITITDITEPAPPPPPPGATTLAFGLPKFLGNVYSTSQILNFTTYWNQVTPENVGKWGAVEGTRDVMNWTSLDAAYALAKDNGFPFRFHVLIWGNQQPQWLQGLPASEQLAEIRQWFQAVAARYPDIDYLEVVNEPLHDRPDGACCNNSGATDSGNYIAALGGAGTTGWDWVITAFQMAREIFPSTTKLMLNEYNIVSSTQNVNTYLTIINLLKARNLIDVIGVQGHAFSTRTTSANDMRIRLDMLANTGLPIQVTEMDIDGNPNSVAGMSQATSGATQLAEYQRVFPLLWEHPAVHGITLWGWRPGLWRNAQHAYLTSPPAGTAPRPAFTWLQEYMAIQRGLATSIDDVRSDVQPTQFSLSQNYPNPFNPSTVIEYAIPATSQVTVQVFDMMGRLVATLVNETQAAGRHSVNFDASNLASGMYIYRLSTGSYQETKRMVLLK